MNRYEIAAVELNPEEQVLFDSICWDADQLLKEEYDVRIENLDRMGRLTEMLLQRDAIPEHRLSYFTDPDMNVGARGKSRMEVFEGNGTSGRDIFRHPHFMPYLRYFLSGPDLPKATVEGFCRIIEEDRGTSGMVLEQICAFVRKEVRVNRLSQGSAAEEFFKLAHEIGKPNLAESVRAAAKSVRR